MRSFGLTFFLRGFFGRVPIFLVGLNLVFNFCSILFFSFRLFRFGFFRFSLIFYLRSFGLTFFFYGIFGGVSIFLFGIIFAWGFTPLQTLYAVECLENRTRAKGSGLNFLFLNIAMVVNTYGISVGIEAIGWKLYIVYIGWICVEIATIYFFFVETAGKTLEEMSEIFNAKNPRKESTKKTRIDVDESGRVVGVDDA